MSEQVKNVTCPREGETCVVERAMDTTASRLRAWPGCCLLRKSLEAELGANGVFGWAGSSVSENSAGGSRSRTRTGLRKSFINEREGLTAVECVISTHTWQLHSLLLFSIILSQYCPTWGFPEGPVFQTLHFQCKEHRFDPGSCGQKVKIKYIYIYIYCPTKSL